MLYRTAIYESICNFSHIINTTSLTRQVIRMKKIIINYKRTVWYNTEISKLNLSELYDRKQREFILRSSFITTVDISLLSWRCTHFKNGYHCLILWSGFTSFHDTDDNKKTKTHPIFWKVVTFLFGILLKA